jgi:hypothetical protein
VLIAWLAHLSCIAELVLQCVSKGVDLFDGSFPYQMSEAGFALTFAFGASSAAQSDAAERCIGLWDTAYVVWDPYRNE